VVCGGRHRGSNKASGAAARALCGHGAEEGRAGHRRGSSAGSRSGSTRGTRRRRTRSWVRRPGLVGGGEEWVAVAVRVLPRCGEEDKGRKEIRLGIGGPLTGACGV
jgi:hypothetical protein